MKGFPDCEVSTCEQRSDEWFSLRKGILTASEFGPWLLTTKTATAKKARENAICKLIAQTADCWEAPNFENAAMQRGTELEPDAVASFEAATKKKIIDVGFCRSTLGLFGCSPDGLLKDGTGFESKAPIPATHIKYRRAGILPPEYEWQVLGSMAVTGAKGWYFQSYNPGLAPLRLYIERTPQVDEIKEALIQFSTELKTALRDEATAWDMEFKAKKAA